MSIPSRAPTAAHPIPIPAASPEDIELLLIVEWLVDGKALVREADGVDIVELPSGMDEGRVEDWVVVESVGVVAGLAVIEDIEELADILALAPATVARPALLVVDIDTL